MPSTRPLNKMPIAQTIDCQIVSLEDFGDNPEAPHEGLNFADFGQGTQFRINYPGYLRRRLEVDRVEDNYIVCSDRNEGGPTFLLNRTNLSFYVAAGKVEILKEAF